MYKGGRLTICDRLTQIKESICYIQQWREEINWLIYFRKFYLSYNNDIIMEKIVIQNNTIEKLKDTAKKIANKLFFEKD